MNAQQYFELEGRVSAIEERINAFEDRVNTLEIDLVALRERVDAIVAATAQREVEEADRLQRLLQTPPADPMRGIPKGRR